MPGPSMSGAELGGRLIALEATVLALAGEVLSALPPEQAQNVFNGMKKIAHDLTDSLAPEFSAPPPLVKEITQHAEDYVDQWASLIEKARAKILTDGAIVATGNTANAAKG